jgi:hypothetical protein
MADGALTFIGEWTTQEPLMEAVIELATGTSDFGELHGWERAESLINMLTPGSQAYKSLTRLYNPDENDPHAQTIGDFLQGERPFTLHFEKSYINALWPEKLKLRDASVQIRDLIRAGADGKVTESEFRRKYQDLEEDRIKAMGQIEFINHSSDVLGFTKSQRRKALATSTLTGDNRIKKHELIDGSWESTYLVPGDVYKDNQPKNSRTTRDYMHWIRVMREVQKDNDWR